MKKIMILGLMTLMSFLVNAKENRFHDLFELERDIEGSIISVKSRPLKNLIMNKDYSFKDYIHFLNESFSVFESCETNFSNKKLKVATEYAKEGIRQKRALFAEILKEDNDILEKFESDIKKKVDLSFSTLALPNRPGFYIKKDIAKTILDGLYSLIQALVPFGETMGLMKDLVDSFIKHFSHHQRYDRYRLAHYLLRYPPEQLGISVKERNTILSSLGETQVGLLGIFALKKMKRTWNSFGRNFWNDKVQASENRVKKNKRFMKRVGENVAPFFFEGETRKNNSGIHNFLNKRGLFVRWPSWAYRPDKPWAVFVERLSYQVMYFGLKFNPWGWLNSIIRYYVNRRFTSQRVTEGSLWVYAYENNHQQMLHWLEVQSLNPLLNRNIYFYGADQMKSEICR